MGQNNTSNYSSPRQVPGTTWDQIAMSSHCTFGIKTDGTLWSWGQATGGQDGRNDHNHRSSPIQLPGTTWAKVYGGQNRTAAIKTDGTLWVWGNSAQGQLGLNQQIPGGISSPIQLGSDTTWSDFSWTYNATIALKTDGTLWSWGYNGNAALGHNNPSPSHRSSPTQIPGTAWTGISKAFHNGFGFKTVSG